MSDPDFTIQGKEIHKLARGRRIERETEFAGDTPRGAGRYKTEQFSGNQFVEYFSRMHGEILFNAMASALQDIDTYFFATVNKIGVVSVDNIFGSFHAIRDYKLVGLNAIAEEGPNGNNSDGRIQLEVYDYETGTAVSPEYLEIDFTDNKTFKRFNDIPILEEGKKYGLRVVSLTTADDVENLEVQFVLQVLKPVAEPGTNGVFSALATAKNNFCATRPPTEDCLDKDGYQAGSLWVDTTGEALLCLDLLPCSCSSGYEGECDQCQADGGCLATPGLNPMAVMKVNLHAKRDPRVTDDELAGYCRGSFWYNTVDCRMWMLIDATMNNAVWTRIDDRHINKIAKSKVNLAGTSVPNSNNDETEGYCPGSMWVYYPEHCQPEVYIAVQVIASQAIWLRVDNDLAASAKSNFTATVDPTPSDNADEPGCYSVGSLWLNRTTEELFMLVNFTTGDDATWITLGGTDYWQTDGTTLSPSGAETNLAIECITTDKVDTGDITASGDATIDGNLTVGSGSGTGTITAVTLLVDDITATTISVVDVIASTIIAGDIDADDVDAISITGEEVNAEYLNLLKPAGYPNDPPEGQGVIWLDDGSSSTTAEDTTGDLFIKVTCGGVTKIQKLFDFSAAPVDTAPDLPSGYVPPVIITLTESPILGYTPGIITTIPAT
jgi:hypothetical protein